MNLTNLKENYPNLLSFMAEKGYKETTIKRYKRQILWILEQAKDRRWTSYEDIYLEYASKSYSYNGLRAKKAILGTLERFDLLGQYPDGKHRYPFAIKKAYERLNPNFKKLVDYYISNELQRGMKTSTIKAGETSISTFFNFLQNKGCNTLFDVTEELVQDFICTGTGSSGRTPQYMYRVRTVLKLCLPLDQQHITRILNYIPKPRKIRKNIPVLTQEEISKIKAVIRDPEGKITRRDRAIGALAFYAGLRSIDIVNMKLSSIDWELNKLLINQQKTGIPIELPLRPIVGNALYDYITLERPALDEPHVFLTTDKPYRPLSFVYQVSNHIFRAADIRQEPGSRKGLHLFRHHMATEMLEQGVPQPVISQLMGHTSPHSIRPYLHTDFFHLKECALSIERLPINEEVFHI